MSNLKIDSAFFCDDVRRENNGKLIAIGMYGNRIFMGSFPAALRFWAMLNVHFPDAGRHAFKVRLNMAKAMLQEVSIEVDATWSGSDWLPVPFEPYVFEQPGEMSLSFEASDGKWKRFYAIPIENFPSTVS